MKNTGKWQNEQICTTSVDGGSEFYEVYEVPRNVIELNPELQKWEYVYNSIRPHQALKYKTPSQLFKDNGIVKSDYLSNLSHM
jgi:transposase InsO family protein